MKCQASAGLSHPEDYQKENLKMKYISVFAVLSILLLVVFPARADAKASDEEMRDDVVGLFGVLLTPSVFTTASMENLSVSVYGRRVTGEGEVPDFDKNPKDEIDEMEIFLSGRMGGLGLTIGFGQGSQFEFSQPVILSVDYKTGFLEETPMLNAAADVQYSMILLPDEENINVSALGFGVLSVSGILSANLLFMLEPYAALTLNYIYLNSEEDRIGVSRIVPKLGLQVKALPMIRVGAEVQIVNNKHLDSAWIWNLGASVRF